jgi:pimeloyl-ACP methyl ester carboxylesterase
MVATSAGSAAWAGPASASHKPSVRWDDKCQDPRLVKAGAECGYVSVPLDYSKPGGTKIELAVSRIKHDKKAGYQGIALVNPGGPGGSGLSLSRLGQFIPKNAGASYDWIGFDPRGVGSSKPALSCLPDYMGPNRPDYIPSNDSLEKTWLDRSKSYAEACGKNGGELLNHLTTVDSAKDMESIRIAFGENKINYYGFSYGTYLGQVYSTLFPQRMRRMVLDGNVDARKVWYQANLDQDVAFERNIKIWFGWVARHDSVYHLGATAAAVEKRWYAEQDKLRGNPAGGVVGPDEWNDIFLQAGYYQVTWPDLGDLFANWVKNGDPAPVVQAYQDTDTPGDDNGYAIYNAVQCTDVQWPQSWDQWKLDNWTTHETAPFETWGNAWFNAPCLYWPAKAHTPVNVGSKVSALLINETLDAATPFEGSLELRRRFPKAVLIAEPGGTTHSGSLGGNECVDNQIADYLATGKLPKRKAGDGPDTTCDPLPEPVPNTAGPSASAFSASSADAAGASLRPFRPVLHGRR